MVFSWVVLGNLAFGALFQFDMGVGLWNQQIDGDISVNGVQNYFNDSTKEGDGNTKTGNFGLQRETNVYLYFKLVHPIPIVPNLKLQYTRYDTTGNSGYLAGGSKVFGVVEIPVGLTDVKSDLQIDSYDLTLFYQLNPLVLSLEVGAGVDFWSGKVRIDGKDNNGQRRVIDRKFYIPLPYLYGGIETMKFFGFSAVGTAKYAKWGDSYHWDLDGGIKYTFNLPGFGTGAVKGGYRIKDIKWVKGNDSSHIKFSGPYAEISLSF